MTTPSVDRPVSEPMTDAELAEVREQHAKWGLSSNPTTNVMVDRLFARLEALAARALPLPRRYTGGPLENGLYLWRRHRWHRPDWESVAVEDGSAHSDHETRTLPGADGWLHDPVMICGPITIPDIPSEEASS